MCSVFIDCQKTCICTQCGRAFETERGLKIHVGKIHKTTQGVTAENSKQPKSLKQGSNQVQSQTIKPQQRSVERSVDNYGGNSTERSVDTDSGNSTESIVKRNGSSRNYVDKQEAADDLG